MVCLNTACTPKFFTAEFVDNSCEVPAEKNPFPWESHNCQIHPCRIPATFRPIPAGNPQIPQDSRHPHPYVHLYFWFVFFYLRALHILYCIILYCITVYIYWCVVGWRPAFKFYSMWLSLVGAVLCIGVMFIMSWVTALVTMAVIAILFFYVHYRKPGTTRLLCCCELVISAVYHYDVMSYILKFCRYRNHIFFDRVTNYQRVSFQPT